MVPAARAFVRAFLDSHPLATDAELIASEYVTNAIRHTASGDGGAIHLTVAATPADGPDRGDRSRAGAPSPGGRATTGPAPRPGEAAGDDENGRGLLIVDYLATRWGHFGVSGGPVTAWAELGDPAAGEPGEGEPGAGGPGDGGLASRTAEALARPPEAARARGRRPAARRYFRQARVRPSPTGSSTTATRSSATACLLKARIATTLGSSDFVDDPAVRERVVHQDGAAGPDPRDDLVPVADVPGLVRVDEGEVESRVRGQGPQSVSSAGPMRNSMRSATPAFSQ